MPVRTVCLLVNTFGYFSLVFLGGNAGHIAQLVASSSSRPSASTAKRSRPQRDLGTRLGLDHRTWFMRRPPPSNSSKPRPNDKITRTTWESDPISHSFSRYLGFRFWAFSYLRVTIPDNVNVTDTALTCIYYIGEGRGLIHKILEHRSAD